MSAPTLKTTPKPTDNTPKDTRDTPKASQDPTLTLFLQLQTGLRAKNAKNLQMLWIMRMQTNGGIKTCAACQTSTSTFPTTVPAPPPCTTSDIQCQPCVRGGKGECPRMGEYVKDTIKRSLRIDDTMYEAYLAKYQRVKSTNEGSGTVPTTTSSFLSPDALRRVLSNLESYPPFSSGASSALTLTSDLAKAREDNENLNKRIEELEKELMGAKGVLELAQKKRKMDPEKDSTLSQELKNFCAIVTATGMGKEGSEMSKRNQALEEENLRLRAELVESREAIRVSRALVKEKDKVIAAHDAAIADRDAVIAAMGNDAAEREDTIKARNGMIKELDEIVAGLQLKGDMKAGVTQEQTRTIEEKSKAISECKTTIAEKDQLIQQLNATVLAARAQVAEAIKKAGGLVEDIKRLEEGNNERDRIIEERDQKIADIQERNKTMLTELAKRDMKMANLDKLNKALEMEVKRLESDLAEQRAQDKGRVQELEENIVALEEIIEEKNSETQVALTDALGEIERLRDQRFKQVQFAQCIQAVVAQLITELTESISRPRSTSRETRIRRAEILERLQEVQTDIGDIVLNALGTPKDHKDYRARGRGALRASISTSNIGASGLTASISGESDTRTSESTSSGKRKRVKDESVEVKLEADDDEYLENVHEDQEVFEVHEVEDGGVKEAQEKPSNHKRRRVV